MQLERLTEGPMGVGAIIKRVNSRSGAPVEGTMEVVEFEPNMVLGMLIQDGPVEMHGRTTFEAVRDDRTTVTFNVEFPDMDDSMDTGKLGGLVQRSLGNIKQLLESGA